MCWASVRNVTLLILDETVYVIPVRYTHVLLLARAGMCLSSEVTAEERQMNSDVPGQSWI